MAVISASFLIGMFFVLYAPVAYATPVTPNTPALLVPRRGAPADNPCREWRSRDCAPERNPRAWDDVCGTNSYDIHVYGRGCPQDTFCQNTFEVDVDQLIEIIQCVPVSKPGVSQPRKGGGDPQIGSSLRKQGVTSVAPSTVYHQLIISDDMLASVSAFFLSDDESHAVRPDNIIVGKLRGKEITVCKGDPSSESKARECYPTGRQQFWQGDIIDFSWGLKSEQAGSLKYLVWPSHTS